MRCVVYDVPFKRTDCEGCWDGTWEGNFKYVIYDDNGEEVSSYEGYRTKEKARLAGEAKMKMLEERK